MYINLKSITGKSTITSSYDFTILAEVVDSTMSYEKPIIIHSRDELNIWFGQDFSDYQYLSNFLDNGIALYLYKPISRTPNTERSGYVDIDKLLSIESWHSVYYMDSSGNYNFPKEGTVGFLYIAINPSSGTHTYERVPCDYYIWDSDLGSYINYDFLPQNNGNSNTESLNNRDTLIVTKKDSSIDYLRYQYIDNGIYENKITTNYIDIKETLNKDTLGKIDSGQLSFVNKIKIRNNSENAKSDDFIELVNSKGEFQKFYYNQDTVENILESIGASSITKGDDYSTATIITPGLIDPRKIFSTLGEDYLVCEPDIESEWYLLGKLYKDDFRIKFLSKTIGESESGKRNPITVKIVNTKPGFLKVTISRFGYSEIFEGPIEDNFDKKERLDYKISKESKLVRCELTNKTSSGNFLLDIPDGTWTLGGAKIEEIDPYSYIYSLEDMFKSEDIYPDFILIPNDTPYIEYYNRISDICESHNTQALIDNSGDKSYNSNLDDPYNRLIYFYGEIYLGNYYNKRPSYYMFLSGILNNTYQPVSSSIYYESPVLEDDDYYNPSENTSLRKDLEKHKSNYMIDNNHIYYYTRYFWGENSKTSGLMRFVIGKISRELNKNKSSFIGEKLNSYIIKTRIYNVLRNIQLCYSGLVRSISIDSFELNQEKESLSCTISTKMSDLVEDNVSIDLTINFI